MGLDRAKAGNSSYSRDDGTALTPVSAFRAMMGSEVATALRGF